MSQPDQTTILAKNTDIGRVYVNPVCGSMLKVLEKYGDIDNGYYSSVLVLSELEPLRAVTISPNTELVPATTQQSSQFLTNHNTTHTKEGTMSTKKAPPKKAPATITRASVIDAELLKVAKGQEPNWEKIADAVVKAKAAPVSARDNVIAQTKVRHAWYTKGGKKNPAAQKAPAK